MFNKDIKVPLQEVELVGTFSSNTSPDIIASWAASTSESVVVWAVFASTEKCLVFRSTINNILRIKNFSAVNALIVALKGIKNTLSVYTGLAAWKMNDLYRC